MSTSSEAASLERIEAAVIDGRAQSPRHIQKQLLALYNALVRSLTSLHQAIAQESGYSSAEVWLETSQALEEVKHLFSKFNVEEYLQDEYTIATGKNRPARRRPQGAIYIIPSSHTRLYSVVQPLSVAIAGGSCAVVELSPESSALDKVLAEALTSALDQETFAVVTQRPQGDVLAAEYTIVAGEPDVQIPSSALATTLKSPGTATIAIVDRTANVVEAARHIVRARFGFRGGSPYAPDLVLVNEFVVEEFSQAALKQLTGQLPSLLAGGDKAKAGKTKPLANGSAHSEPSEGTLLVSTARGRIELFTKRDKLPADTKTRAPLLIIHPISSLDDAIDTAQTRASTSGTLSALYLFAEPKSAKYLSQFVSADLSLTNYIPPQLLVGPGAPSQYPTSIAARYTKEMFSSPSPELIVPTDKEQYWARYLDGELSRHEADRVMAGLVKPLSEDVGEPDGAATGFFEQGFHTGLIVEAVLVTGILAASVRFAVRRLLR